MENSVSVSFGIVFFISFMNTYKTNVLERNVFYLLICEEVVKPSLGLLLK